MPHCSMFGGSPPEVTYLGAGGGPFNIGPARNDRILVSFFFGESDAAAQLSAASIGGSAANIINNPVMADAMGAAWRQVTSGTTASVSGTLSGLSAIHTIMITGLANNALATSNTAGSSGANLDLPLTMPDGFSVAVAGARSRGSNSGYTGVSTGVLGAAVTDASANVGGGTNISYGVAHASCSDAGAGQISINGSGYSSGYGFAAVFN